MNKRNLSGIYFRHKDPETEKYDSVCFEDLPEDTQDEMLNDREITWLKSLIKQLSNTLREIGDHFDISKE